jgi:hypothetical protein
MAWSRPPTKRLVVAVVAGVALGILASAYYSTVVFKAYFAEEVPESQQRLSEIQTLIEYCDEFPEDYDRCSELTLRINEYADYIDDATKQLLKETPSN